MNTTIPIKFDADVALGRDILRRFKLPQTEFGPDKVIRIFDHDTNTTWGFVVVDNLVRGPSLGGIRLEPDVTVEEVYGLAHAMTFKNAAAMLPLGGGKSGLIGDPVFYSENPLQKKKLITHFAEVLWEHPEYIPGPDMGTDENDMQLIYDTFTHLNGKPNHGRGGIGRPPEKGGLPLDEWGLTAHGLLAAAKAAEENDSEFNIEGARVIIQGYGNVGCHIAEKLYAEGAVITGASDINCGLYNPDGLDIDEMREIRRERSGLLRYTGPTKIRFTSENLDELLTMPCDILIPAARPDAITVKNADVIDTRIILQGANNPVNHVTEYYLSRKKKITPLTDFIVNAGGVIACAVELKMDQDPDYRQKVTKKDGLGKDYLEQLVFKIISDNVNEIYQRMKKNCNQNIIWRDVAMDLAQERLQAGKNGNVPTLKDFS